MLEHGQQIYRIAEELFPICRSITGNGVRESFRILKKYAPQLSVKEIASGTQVFDWEVPREWNISEGYIENSCGKRIIDFQENNLHIMGYSIPVDQYVPLGELKKYIYTEKKTAVGYPICNIVL